MLKIANVIEEGKLGGPQVRMVRVASALAGEAKTLIVMPQTNSASFREMCEANDVAYHMLPLTRITKEWRAALAYIVFSPLEVLRLARLFRTEQIDLVHVSGGSWQYKAVIAARLAGIPSVWHLNDTFAPIWVRWLFQFLSPLASGFIFASHQSELYYGDLIRSSHVKRRAVIPSTVDHMHFDPARTYPVDTDLPNNNEVPVIGTVANVNPIKGLETLIYACGDLRDRGHLPHVVFVGPIFDRQRKYYCDLMALAKELGLDRIQFVGSRTDVRPLLMRFDIYVCSSLAESSPVAVWESMAMARPVVSTDVGDVAIHVKDGLTGFVVDVQDSAMMADRIAELLENPGLRMRMGTAARMAVKPFSPSKIADATLTFYRKVLSDHDERMRSSKGS